MGIFDVFKKKESKSTDIDFIKPSEDQEHLTSDGRLPWGWYAQNKNFIDNISEEYKYFFDNWYDSKKLSPKEQYAALKSFVMYMNDAKKLCYAKNECFAYWFDGVASPEYIDEMVAELEELEKNVEQLQESYTMRMNLLDGLEDRVVEKLIECDGIIQSEFLKMFDKRIKDDVSYMLYNWSNEGKIERIKSGRSYILHLRKKEE